MGVGFLSLCLAATDGAKSVQHRLTGIYLKAMLRLDVMEQLLYVVAGQVRQLAALSAYHVIMLFAAVCDIAVTVAAALSYGAPCVALAYQALELSVYGGTADPFTLFSQSLVNIIREKVCAVRLHQRVTNEKIPSRHVIASVFFLHFKLPLHKNENEFRFRFEV